MSQDIHPQVKLLYHANQAAVLATPTELPNPFITQIIAQINHSISIIFQLKEQKQTLKILPLKKHILEPSTPQHPVLSLPSEGYRVPLRSYQLGLLETQTTNAEQHFFSGSFMVHITDNRNFPKLLQQIKIKLTKINEVWVPKRRASSRDIS